MKTTKTAKAKRSPQPTKTYELPGTVPGLEVADIEIAEIIGCRLVKRPDGKWKVIGEHLMGESFALPSENRGPDLTYDQFSDLIAGRTVTGAPETTRAQVSEHDVTIPGASITWGKSTIKPELADKLRAKPRSKKPAKPRKRT